MAVATDPALALNLIQRVCVGDILIRGAERFGEKPALVDGAHELSYRELDARANAVGIVQLKCDAPERVGELRETLDADVLLGSGQTAFLPPTCFQRPGDQVEKPDSWGPATTLTDIRVMDEGGNLLPRGEVATATASEEELLEWCETRLAPFKVPKRIVLIDEFPRTGTGKIQKQPLRERHRTLYSR